MSCEPIDRRLRAETIDIIGRCTVPTRDAGRIPHPDCGHHPSPSAAGGCMPTDCRRKTTALIRSSSTPRSREQQGTLPVPYESQPYLPKCRGIADAVPGAGGPHLVYADVWQREVTHMEEPDLVDKAVGVDTATRLQTVWQVKVLPDVRPASPAPDRMTHRRWQALTSPSAGSLTTSAVGVPVDTDPCVVRPAGGFPRHGEPPLSRRSAHRRTAGIDDLQMVARQCVDRIHRDRDRCRPHECSRSRAWAAIHYRLPAAGLGGDHGRSSRVRRLPGVMAKVQSVDEPCCRPSRYKPGSRPACSTR